MKKIVITSLATLGFWTFALAQYSFELVKDIHPTGSSFPNLFNEYNGKLFFVANDGIHDWEPWITDGTESGTQLFKDINPNADPSFGSYMQSVTIHNGLMYFYAWGDTQEKGLWVSDGTPEGTIFLKNIPYITKTVVHDGKLFFSANDFWTTDGTSEGTYIVKKTYPEGIPGISSSMVRNLCVINGHIYFVGFNGSWIALFKSDGTAEGTEEVFTLEGSVEMADFFTVFNDKLIYIQGDHEGKKLWVTDGTEVGTYKLSDVLPGGMAPDYRWGFTEYNGKLYFPGNDGTHGFELWVTDGTIGGTYMVKDINPNNDAFYKHGHPKEMTVHNGKLYFSANDGEHGDELWVSDGTEQGTYMVKDIDQFLSLGSNPRNFISHQDKLFFVADYTALKSKLFVSDGTESGTYIIEPAENISDNPCKNTTELYVFNNDIYLCAGFTAAGHELWRIKFGSTNILEVSEKKKWSVFPNPAHELITIVTTEKLNLSLYDLVGREIKSWITNGTEEISLSELSSGVYLLVDNLTGESFKIVKE